MGIARYERRLIAYIIDEGLACLFGIAMGILASRADFLDDSPFPLFLLAAASAYVFYIVFCTLFSLIARGSTLGCLICGIKAVHPDGRPYTFRDCLLRSLAKGILAAVLANAIYMLAAHTERSVFDRLGDTLVVYRRAR